MHTLLLCSDLSFLGITRTVLKQLEVHPEVVGKADTALKMIQAQDFDVIILDWREIDNAADFLCAVRRSKQNRDCVLVAIVRDLLDLKQAFAAGVHFLIHKPASAMQIERCLRAAYSATVARRRKQHREPVDITALATTHANALFDVRIVNLSEGGAAVEINPKAFQAGTLPSVADEIKLRFALPENQWLGDERSGGQESLDVTGKLIWSTVWKFGVKFAYIPDRQRAALERWLTDCVERNLAQLREKIRVACA